MRGWIAVLLLVAVAGCGSAHAKTRDIARAKAEAASLIVFSQSAEAPQPEPTPAPQPGRPQLEQPTEPPTPPAVEPVADGPVDVDRDHNSSALGPASPQWTWPGDIYQHLVSTHGVSAAGLSHSEAVTLHNRLHNAAATKPVASPQITWQTTTSTSCPGGVCLAPSGSAGRAATWSRSRATVQRRGLFRIFRRR